MHEREGSPEAMHYYRVNCSYLFLQPLFRLDTFSTFNMFHIDISTCSIVSGLFGNVALQTK